MNDEPEQFEPARPRRRRPRNPRGLLFAGVVILVGGFSWSACVAALWSTNPEVLADNGLALVGCFLASLICYVTGLVVLVVWKNQRR